MSTNGDDDTQDPKIRHEFVAVVFALALGEVAGQVIDRWNLLLEPAYFEWAHLILMTAMIAASWVGWSNARVAGARQDATEVFSRNFLVLLVDLVIVITYFFMARGLHGNDQYSLSPSQFVKSDTVGMCIVFSCYILWDFLVAIGDWYELWRWVVSIFCTGLCFLVYARIGGFDSNPACCDGALLCAVLLFRAWQQQLPIAQRKHAKNAMLELHGKLGPHSTNDFDWARAELAALRKSVSKDPDPAVVRRKLVDVICALTAKLEELKIKPDADLQARVQDLRGFLVEQRPKIELSLCTVVAGVWSIWFLFAFLGYWAAWIAANH